MEYCDGGSVFDFTARHPAKLSELEVGKIFTMSFLPWCICTRKIPDSTPRLKSGERIARHYS